MPGKGKHGFVRSVRRFFWLPREMPRRPAPVRPTLWNLLYCLAVGAFVAAIGWDDEAAAPSSVMTVVTVLAMFDDMIKGVRHRWPAFVAALAVGWAGARLARAAVPGLADSLWVEFAAFAPVTAAVLATFVAVSRLPQHRRL